jgi:hypothetical protein
MHTGASLLLSTIALGVTLASVLVGKMGLRGAEVKVSCTCPEKADRWDNTENVTALWV